ncbi:MAG: hypothetical protein ACRCSG_07065 [Cellulosilyticaceae bacterium]
MIFDKLFFPENKIKKKRIKKLEKDIINLFENYYEAWNGFCIKISPNGQIPKLVKSITDEPIEDCLEEMDNAAKVLQEIVKNAEKYLKLEKHLADHEYSIKKVSSDIFKTVIQYTSISLGVVGGVAIGILIYRKFKDEIESKITIWNEVEDVLDKNMSPVFEKIDEDITMIVEDDYSGNVSSDIKDLIQNKLINRETVLFRKIKEKMLHDLVEIEKRVKGNINIRGYTPSEIRRELQGFQTMYVKKLLQKFQEKVANKENEIREKMKNFELDITKIENVDDKKKIQEIQEKVKKRNKSVSFNPNNILEEQNDINKIINEELKNVKVNIGDIKAGIDGELIRDVNSYQYQNNVNKITRLREISMESSAIFDNSFSMFRKNDGDNWQGVNIEEKVREMEDELIKEELMKETGEEIVVDIEKIHVRLKANGTYFQNSMVGVGAILMATIVMLLIDALISYVEEFIDNNKINERLLQIDLVLLELTKVMQKETKDIIKLTQDLEDGIIMLDKNNMLLIDKDLKIKMLKINNSDTNN